MKPPLANFFKQPIILLLLVFISQNILQAQHNPGEADGTLGLGKFNSTVTKILEQPNGKVLVGGYFTNYENTTVNRISRLNSDGSLDHTFNIGTGANQVVSTIAVQSDGKILIGGAFTSFNGVTRNYLARLNSDGSLDNTFNIGVGPSATINSIVVQSDDKILVGGAFTTFNGIFQPYIIRLNQDGTKDNTFSIGSGANNKILSIAVQSDGKILCGGDFTDFSGVTQNYITRLNPDGSIDNSFNIGTGADDRVAAFAFNSDGKILVGGYFTNFNGVAINRLVRLNLDGTIDNTFNVNAWYMDNPVYTLAVEPGDKILVGGDFSNNLVRLNYYDGSIDNTFNIRLTGGTTVFSIAHLSNGKIWVGGMYSGSSGHNSAIENFISFLNNDGSIDNFLSNAKGSNGAVYEIATQADGKILVGGSFTSFNSTSQPYIVRLNLNGSLDNTFNIGTGINDYVESIALQADGKILVGGNFATPNVVARNRLVRLNSDGSIDNTFNIGTGANNYIYSIIVQSDSKILIGGEFTNFNGVAKSRLVRLNSDGSIDNTFNIGTGANDDINSIIVQSDNKILLGGVFTNFNGISKNYIVRLNSDGTIDNSFNVGVGANNTVQSLELQSDNKILVGGSFTTFNGVSKVRIVRLNSDGSIDPTFNTVCNGRIESFKVQSDGKILAGGSFTIVNGVSMENLVRLNPNGSIDNTFNIGTGANIQVYSVAVESDGRILVGGYFSAFNDVAYNRIVRLKGNSIHFNTIRGNIYTEYNKDCNYQITENPIQSVIVKALPGPYYGNSDLYGKYKIGVDSGTVNYTITQELNSISSKFLVNQCTPSYTVNLKGASKDTCCFNFADSTKNLPLLNISVQKSRTRRCFRSNTVVNYCNHGTANASNTQVKVIYPSYIIPISSTPMWSSKQDSVLIFDIGIFQANGCGSITIIDSVDCGNQSIRGLTQCIKATIGSPSLVVSPNPGWDRSSINVTGTCTNGDVVFTIKNAGSGNMLSSHDYRVYVNDTLVKIDNFQLNTGNYVEITYPAQGQTIRLEADQHPLHPGRSRPRATVEDCGSTAQGAGRKGLVTTVPQDDLDEEVAIACNQIVDSYDPNDKQVIPAGIGSTNRIAPGTELEYAIRFQNTGTDTAYTVRVVDTLDVSLDVASFTNGTSSHPYTLNVSGKGKAVLSFNFYNINLPDSTKNNVGSNGLVSFRIKVSSNTATGTQIKNKAHIYFDYNSAIITNETMQTVDNTVISDPARGAAVQEGQVIAGIKNRFSETVNIYPNPTQGIVTVEIPEQRENTEIRIYSTTGVLQKSVNLNSTKQQINLEGMNQGMYLFEIRQDGERKAGGMLEVR